MSIPTIDHSSKSNRIISSIMLFLSLVIAVFPHWLRPVCGPMENGNFMACHYSAIYTAVVFAVLAVCLLIQILVNRKGGYIAGSLLSVLAVVFSYLLVTRKIRIPVPGLEPMMGQDGQMHVMTFGLCKKADMACHQSYAVIHILMLVLTLLAVVLLLKAWTEKKN